MGTSERGRRPCSLWPLINQRASSTLQEKEEEEEERMDELQVVEFVATYLKKKGFSEAENALQAEIQRNKSSNNTNPIDILNDPELSKFFRTFSEYTPLFSFSLLMSFFIFYFLGLNFVYYWILLIIEVTLIVWVLGFRNFRTEIVLNF